MSDTSLVFNLVARERVSETLGKVKEKFNQAATAISAGVAGALGVGVAAAMDMSAANAKLAAQLGIGPAKAAELSKVSANVYAGAWGDSAETVNEAIRGVYQNIGDTSGVKGGLEGATKDVLALSEAFDVDLAMSTKTVGQLMKTGLAKDAGEAMDLITWGMQHGLNASDDLLDTLNEYSPQFKKLGLDGKSSLGLLNAMMQAGVRDSDAAADAIKEFGLRSISTSKAVTDAYTGIGLDADEMRKKIAAGGPSGAAAMGQVFEALKKIKDPIKQNNLGTALMGTQWEDTVRSILPNLDMTKAHIQGVAGSTEKMSDTLANSPAKALERFKREATTKLAEVAGGFVKFAMDNQAAFEPIAYTLGGIAAAVLAIKGGMMVWTAAQTAWSAATTIATGVQWLWNAAMAANPVVWVIVGIVALVAAIVLIATKTTWFQQLWDTVWSAVQTAISVVWTWIQTNWPLLLAILTGPIGAAVLVIYRYWDQIQGAGEAVLNWFKALPGRIGGALSSMGSVMLSAGMRGFQMLKNGAAQKATAFTAWVAGLPGRIARAIGSLNNLLYSKGMDIVRGLWNGIRSMGSWLRSTLIGWAKDLIPGPIAKALGIGSPSKLMAAEIGHWIPPGIAMGAEDNRGVLDKAMAGLVNPQAAVPARPLTGMAPIMGAAAGGGAVRVVVDTAGADGEMKRLMRKLVRVEGRGNVQVAFGQ